jgi:LmbE family N-acetylglucosaminyl deacetylase
MLKRYLKEKNIKNLLVIFPHPDDESYSTGLLLLTAKKLGIKTNVIILTKGEKGSSNIQKGIQLSSTREEELRQASNELGIDNLVIGNFKDAEIKDYIEVVKEFISGQIKSINPDLVVTYDHGGFTGHPDHIATSVLVLELCKSINIPLLFYTPIGMNKVLNKNLAQQNNCIPTYFLNPILSLKKVKAFFKHQSQISKFGFLYKGLLAIFILISSEAYHLVDFSKEYKYEYFPFRID